MCHSVDTRSHLWDENAVMDGVELLFGFVICSRFNIIRTWNLLTWKSSGALQKHMLETYWLVLCTVLVPCLEPIVALLTTCLTIWILSSKPLVQIVWRFSVISMLITRSGSGASPQLTELEFNAPTFVWRMAWTNWWKCSPVEIIYWSWSSLTLLLVTPQAWRPTLERLTLALWRSSSKSHQSWINHINGDYGITKKQIGNLSGSICTVGNGIKP